MSKLRFGGACVLVMIFCMIWEVLGCTVYPQVTVCKFVMVESRKPCLERKRSYDC